MTTMTRPQAVATGQPRYAGFWIRLVAFLVDAVAIGAIASLFTFGRAGIVLWDATMPFDAWRNLVDTTVGLIYFTILWSGAGGGRTLGMRLLGLRVVGADGGPIGLGQALARWVGIVISAALLLIGLAWVAIDPRKQGWHDKIAGSFVVHATDTTEAGR